MRTIERSTAMFARRALTRGAAAGVLSVALVTAATVGAGPALADSPAFTFSSASAAFDRTKPAVVHLGVSSTATYQITLPDADAARATSFITSDARRVRDLGITTVTEAFNLLIRDLSADMRAHPDQYFPAGHETRSTTQMFERDGSGTIISPDGIVVTASDVTPDDKQLAAFLADKANTALRQKLQNETAGAAGQAAGGLAADAPPGSDPAAINELANTYISVGVEVAMKTMKLVGAPATTRSVHLGPAFPGAGTQVSALPATVLLSTAAPGKAGISLLRIKGTDFPAARLGPDRAIVDGTQGALAGYDDALGAAGLGSIDATVVPTHVDGLAKAPAGQTPSFSTTLGPAKVGGPFVDAAGNVVGIAVSTGSLAGADRIAAALTTAQLVPRRDPAAQTYDSAVDAYDHHYYRRALTSFKRLAVLRPQYPYVAGLISRSTTAIANGLDKTPTPLSLPLVGVDAVILAAIMGLLATRYRRRLVAAVLHRPARAPGAGQAQLGVA
jgi:hypothetical protein